VFLDAGTIDAADEPDLDHLAVRGYFVVGYPAARSRSRVSPQQRLVQHTPFQFTAYPAGQSTYATKGLDRGSHLLLKYDQKAVLVDGIRTHPPRLQGIDGGAILRFSSLMPEFRLVAIGTEHRKQARAIVGTRIGQVLTLAREVIRSGDPKLFE
jgi:hypothetical protein